MIKETAEEINPIFDVSFNYVDFHVFDNLIADESEKPSEDSGFRFQNYVNNNTLFDLHVFAHNAGLQIGLTYSSTIIDGALSLRIFDYFKGVLNAFVNQADSPVDQNSIYSKS